MSIPWFFGKISRKEAEQLLMEPSLEHGTYLVRDSESHPLNYAVSVKVVDPTSRSASVMHRLIICSRGFYFCGNSLVNPIFPTLQSLVTYYTDGKNFEDGRPPLGRTCPKPNKSPKPELVAEPNNNLWNIKRGEIEFVKEVGQGFFCKVWYGKCHNRAVAVKMLKLESKMSSEDLLREAKIMKKLCHRRIVTLYAVCSEKEPIYLVEEYMNGGSLLTFLHEDSNNKMADVTVLARIASQVAEGMAYLGSNQVVHRDLAARNVLLGDSYEAKICDFGMARITEGGVHIAPKSILPTKWTAPEAIANGRFSIKSDVWSFGVLLMEMCTRGGKPYPDMDFKTVIERVNQGYRMPKPANFPMLQLDALYRLMLRCWKKDPVKRPSFDSLFVAISTKKFL